MGLESYACKILEKSGIKAGQRVLDFGCGSGAYAIPAAKIVGENGTIYALDKDKHALDELVTSARKRGLKNIKRIASAGDLRIELGNASVDSVILFDVFHSYYFPERRQRKRLLEEIRRVLKPGGALLVYPKHMEREAEKEIRDLDFPMETICSGTLIHDGNDLLAGDVLVFRKRLSGDGENSGSLRSQQGHQDCVGDQGSFKNYAVVSCGTLSPELNHLRASGFLDARMILYTRPGLHENPRDFEKHLRRQLRHAKGYAERVMVVYGARCYIDTIDPFKTIDKIIQDTGDQISRVNAANCIDMLAGSQEREEIKNGEKVYWLSPGWLKYWRIIFKEWDIGLANETFPKNDKAVLLDALGFFDAYIERCPERILEFSDWMKIGIEPYAISLDRLKALLLEAAREDDRAIGTTR
jgi:precorrin-6B methylase 2